MSKASNKFINYRKENHCSLYIKGEWEKDVTRKNNEDETVYKLRQANYALQERNRLDSFIEQFNTNYRKLKKEVSGDEILNFDNIFMYAYRANLFGPDDVVFFTHNAIFYINDKNKNIGIIRSGSLDKVVGETKLLHSLFYITQKDGVKHKVIVGLALIKEKIPGFETLLYEAYS